jgi:lactate 2-monooxygenase
MSKHFMENPGPGYQFARFSGADPYRDFPVSLEEWREAAKKVVPRDAWDYLEGGAGSESTLNSNTESFSKWRLRPRYLRDVSRRSLSVSLLGRVEPTPFVLAPMGALSVIHADAEIAAARAAGKSGIPFVLSTVSSHSIEEVATQAPETEKWFQLYPAKDMEIVKSMIRRAESSGYRVLVVTVDTFLLGWRVRDLRNSYLPFLKGAGLANYLTDQVFLSQLKRPPEEDMMGAISRFLSVYVNPQFTWSHLKQILEFTKLPVVLKGITHPQDVKLAVDAGVSGIVVSNHGGRQLDGAVSTIDALSQITEAPPPRTELLLDGGIRHACDAMKAIALGARAVMIGRPYAYALAVGGERGVEAFLSQLLAEFDLELGLSGFSSPSEINRECVTRV